MIPMAMVTVNKLANGYLVRFHQPIERERVVPNPIPPGLFAAQAQIAMALRESDDELIGAESWDKSRREDREKRVTGDIARIERKLAHQKVRQWVLEPQEFMAASLADVMALMQQADAALEKTFDLLRSGVALHGLPPGSMIVPA